MYNSVDLQIYTFQKAESEAEKIELKGSAAWIFQAFS